MVLKLGNHLVCQKDNQTEEEKGKTKNNKICKILRRHTQMSENKRNWKSLKPPNDPD